MVLSKKISDAYDEFLASGDSRVTSWPLMGQPGPIIIVVVMYLLFVKFIGPAWMRNRESFDLRNPMFLYNMGLVFAHVYFIKDFIPILMKKIHGGICMKQDKYDPDSIRMAELGWWFFFIKIVELADTIFFVLRKKFDHISKLHVIHHSIAPILTWVGFRIEPVGYNYFFPFVNSLVHTVMYTYYALSALGPNVQKYLWWKRYLTSLQIIQFILAFFYQFALGLNCEVSKSINITSLVVAVFFLILFVDYFKTAYKTSPAEKHVD